MFKITLITLFIGSTTLVAKIPHHSVKNEANQECIQKVKRRLLQKNYKSKKLFRKLKIACQK